ncbi:hypothetical protein Tco_0608952 [Tanacetum coccineum]
MKSLKKHLKKLAWKNGDVFENVKRLREFVKEKFLGESKDVEKISDMGSLLQNKLSIEDATFMIWEISDEEIKHAMFQIDDNKAPGPDGFSTHFFKKA